MNFTGVQFHARIYRRLIITSMLTAMKGFRRTFVHSNFPCEIYENVLDWSILENTEGDGNIE